MIKIANSSMICELKAVWKECFKDEDNYIDFYYEKRFSSVTTLVKYVDEQIASMLTLIPCELVINDRIQKLYYVYAVATRNKYQKRGYAKELILYAQQMARKEGAKTFLVPASQSLFRYYEKLGYQTAGYKTIARSSIAHLRQMLGAEEKSKSIQVKELTPYEFYELREKAFAKNGFIRWDQKGLTYSLEEHRFCGGHAVLVKREKEIGAVLYHYFENEKKFYVKEATLEFEALIPVLLHLCDGLDVDTIELNRSRNDNPLDTTTEFAMLSQSDGEYLGFVNLVKD